MKFAVSRVFLPGNRVADLLGAKEADERTMNHTPVDMPFRDAVMVLNAEVICR